jgi:hypothetical protein
VGRTNEILRISTYPQKENSRFGQKTIMSPSESSINSIILVAFSKSTMLSLLTRIFLGKIIEDINDRGPVVCGELSMYTQKGKRPTIDLQKPDIFGVELSCTSQRRPFWPVLAKVWTEIRTVRRVI